jgi:hypothetical protein
MSNSRHLRRISNPRTKLLAARCECLHLIKMNCLALWLDESAHASLAARSFVRGLEIRLYTYQEENAATQCVYYEKNWKIIVAALLKPLESY